LPIPFEDLLLVAYPMTLGIEKPEINVQYVLWISETWKTFDISTNL